MPKIVEEFVTNVCDSCGFHTDKLRKVVEDDGELWFCELCYRSGAYESVLYPDNCSSEHGLILQNICFVGNIILKKLEQKDYSEWYDYWSEEEE